MKKFEKVILILFCVLVVTAGLLIGGVCILHSINPDYEGFDRTETFAVNLKENNIKSLSAELPYGDIKLVGGSAWNVRFENVPTESAKAVVEGDTLFISVSFGKDFSIMNWSLGFALDPGNFSKPTVYVTYPEGMEFEDVNLQLGLGNCTLKDVTSKTIVCQDFAGRVEADRCRFKEKSAFQLLFGSLKADDVMFRNGSVDVFTGICRITLDETSRTADVDAKMKLGYKSID